MIFLLPFLFLFRAAPFALNTALLIGAKFVFAGSGSTAVMMNAILTLGFNFLALIFPPISALEVPFLSWAIWFNMNSYDSTIRYVGDNFVSMFEQILYYVDPAWTLLEGFFTCFCIQGIGQVIVHLNERQDSVFEGRLAYPSLLLSIAGIIWSAVSSFENNTICYVAFGIFALVILLNLLYWEQSVITDVGLLCLYANWNRVLMSSSLQTNPSPLVFTMDMLMKKPLELIWNTIGFIMAYRLILMALSYSFIRMLTYKTRKTPTKGFNFNFASLFSRHAFQIVWITILTRYLNTAQIEEQVKDHWVDITTWRTVNFFWSIAVYIVLMVLTQEEDFEIWQDAIAHSIELMTNLNR